MKITDLEIGTNVFIDVERGNLYFTLSSKVIDIDERGVHIAPPYDRKGEVQYLKDRDDVYLRIVKERGIVKWSCTSWRDDRVKDLKTLYLSSEHSSEVENRREAFRLPVVEDIQVTDLKTQKVLSAHVKDISLTGVGLILKEKVEQSDSLSVCLTGHDEYVKLTVKVVRHQIIDEDKILHGCVTLKSDHSLVKYINKVQQAELRKRSNID